MRVSPMPYDLSEAFEAIEDELIGSMVRNLKRHQAEESRLGFEWEQWQALQLKALEDYRRRNKKKFPPRFNKLNAQIEEMLRESYTDGRTSQEQKILRQILKGFKPSKRPFGGSAELQGNFFGVNDRKLDALINAVHNDMERAEYAVLRRADDQYRQVIYNAQVYANTGSGTYQKAVDMATRDFLRAGLDCVEYKDGSRHTLEDYADMAIKTANKRAYLQGEGSMRDEWGIPTVIMNKRSCPCPKCAPFVGKVFIDDVWSGGHAVAGTDEGVSPVTGAKYPLMSAAIRQGLYHPRCKDVHSTYFEGISTPPEDSQYTADELDAMAEKYGAEQKQNYCERQEKRYDRMSRYSLDPDNQRMYGARAKAFGEKAETYKNSVKSVENPDESGIINTSDMNYAKADELFGITGNTVDEVITPEAVIEDLGTTKIGKEILSFLEEIAERPIFDYVNLPRTKGVRGEEFGGKITLYLRNCKDIKTAACTLIHECTHLKYGIGYSQWAEAVCYAKELQHRRNTEHLAMEDLRKIVKVVRDNYTEYNWRKGGIINGRRKRRKTTS